ncbi:hypothetical protein AB6E88_16180 [Providencia hangzhouensis]
MNFRFIFLLSTLTSLPLAASANTAQIIDQQINNQASQDRSRQQQTQLEAKDALGKTRERSNNILVFDDEKDCFQMKQVILLSEPKTPFYATSRSLCKPSCWCMHWY